MSAALIEGRQKVLNRLREIRQKNAQKSKSQNFNPLNYVCTESACVDLGRQ